MTVSDIIQKKSKGEKITVLTAYDYPTAQLLDKAGIDVILVGDSLANVVLGLESTTQVGMREMLHHCKAVSRAVQNALVVADMPFESYQIDSNKALANAQLFISEACCHAVKLEWFDNCAKVTEKIVKDGISVMGHVGLTPQTASKEEGMKVQGRDAASAKQILEQAKILQEAGCFAVVLECVPREVAKMITAELKIPTIGIGAGPDCDGQVLVSHDVLGLVSRYHPKFAKKYADLSAVMVKAFEEYKNDVKSGHFPDDDHSFHMSADESKKLSQ